MKTYCRAAFVILFFGLTVAANAQATRTWVSGVGDDANPCSRTAPCKTFAGAISKTATGGQISVLDPGGFGAVTITKSITLDGTGTLGSILASAGSGIIINNAGAIVTIRGLQLDGAGTGLNGVRIVAATAVNIEDCVIMNFRASSSANGVSIESGSKVRIADTKITNSLGNGVIASPVSGTATVVLENVQSFNNGGSGVQLTNSTNASISRSSLTHNTQGGVLLVQSSDVNIFRTVMAFNSYGIYAGSAGAAVARIDGCEITNNTADGIHLGFGQVFSYQNNAIQANAGNSTPTGPIPQQ